MYRRAIADCGRRGRCYFFIATLHKWQSVAVSAVEMAFDFMKDGAPVAGPDRPDDELSALVAAEGPTVADFLEAMVAKLSETQAGQETLRGVAAKHADVLLPAAMLREIADSLDAAKRKLLNPQRHG